MNDSHEEATSEAAERVDISDEVRAASTQAIVTTMVPDVDLATDYVVESKVAKDDDLEQRELSLSRFDGVV